MNIFKEMTQDCGQANCRIVPSRTGISNSAGSGSTYSCRTCGREWSVWHSDNWASEQVFDRNGNDISPPPEPPSVKATKGPREPAVSSSVREANDG